MEKDFINKKGFTLAEVLITLAVIGVVAALTIPAVVRNYQKTQAVTRLKKVYSAVNNAVRMNYINGSDISNSDVIVKQNHATVEERVYFMQNYFVPYLKVQKGCYIYPNVANCWYSTNGKGAIFRNIKGSGGYQLCAAIVLQDGSAIGMIEQSSYPNLVIDINGKKRPNVLGKDMFELTFDKTKKQYVFAYNSYKREDLINPEKFSGNGGACVDGNSRYDGLACGALIMKDSWEMKDDYPW